MRIQDGTGSSRAVEVDTNHRLQIGGIVTDRPHEYIHEGVSYVVSKSQTTANADGNVTILTFKTGTDKIVHIFPSLSATGTAWFYIYENPTIANNTGTDSVAVYNRNRLVGNTSTIIDTKPNPDITGSVTYWDETDGAGANITLGDGTLLYSEQIAAGRTSFAISRNEAEFNLAKDTYYAFVLENEGASANIHNIILNWYEV